jgi:type IV secretory pathway TrbL component
MPCVCMMYVRICSKLSMLSTMHGSNEGKNLFTRGSVLNFLNSCVQEPFLTHAIILMIFFLLLNTLFLLSVELPRR